MQVYEQIMSRKAAGKKTLALLLDPEKTRLTDLPRLCHYAEEGGIDLIFVGGSGYYAHIDNFVKELKKYSIPVVLFPGNREQFTPAADAILFLSLVSGRNPEFLIGQHIKVAKAVKESGIEIIPTGYILIEGGRESSVAKASQTQPLREREEIVSTAIAAELTGKRLIYLEAGSGAIHPVDKGTIMAVRTAIEVPLIVGGGIRSTTQMRQAFEAGADIVVIGNHFEHHPEDIVDFGLQHSLSD